MKSRVFSLLTFAFAITLALSSCVDGGTGYLPSDEFEVVDDNGFLIRRVATAVIDMNGERVTSVTANFPFRLSDEIDTIVSADSEIDFQDGFKFKFSFGSVPSEPTTIVFDSLLFNALPILDPVLSGKGVIVMAGSTAYFPQSLKLVITAVKKDAQNRVRLVEGTLEGSFRAYWPSNWELTAGYPPGFDPFKPSLVGEKLTVYGCKFRIGHSKFIGA